MSNNRINHRDKDNHETNKRTHTFLTAEEIAAGKKPVYNGLEICGNIKFISPALWKMTHLTSLYLNDNSISRLPPDISKLSCLTHLDISSNKLRSLPQEVGDLLRLRELLANNNYLRVLPYELGKLYRLQNLGLKGNPLSQEIMVLYNDPNGTSRLLSYLNDNLAIPTQRPPDRPWITLRQPSKHRPSCIFTVMSYNVLSDKLVTRQLYGYCPNWALSWEYRRKAIIEEIRNCNADIISLQEVETEKFYNFFKPEMEKMGYDGIFSPKSRAKTMTENERKHVDGCAIFYRCNKFTLVSEHLMEFNQLAMANAEGSDNMLNRVMTKDNIGLAALLQTKESAFEINGSNNAPLLDRLNNTSSLGKNNVNGSATNGNNSTSTLNNGLSSTHTQPLLVSTAHMHWNPEYSDVKLIQTMMLIHELRRIAQQAYANYRDVCQIPEGSTDPATAIPLVFCADLNSLPASAVVEFLSTGIIAADHADFKEIPYKDCLLKLSTTPENKTHYNHPFKISKAYPDDLMPYTNYTADFKGVIDYIFYSKAHMSTLGLLGPLDPEWIKDNKIVGCPHPYLPSDHFPLLSEFELPLAQPNGNSNSGNNQQQQAQNQSNQLSNGVLRR